MKSFFAVNENGEITRFYNVPYGTDHIVVEDDVPELNDRFGYDIIYSMVDGHVVGEYVQRSPKLLREAAYIGEHCITYEGELITVDQANKLWQEYFAEGNDKATEISALIRTAKAEIRARFPD